MAEGRIFYGNRGSRLVSLVLVLMVLCCADTDALDQNLDEKHRYGLSSQNVTFVEFL